MDWTFELVHGPLGRPIGGLAWDGEAMLFSDINENGILRFDPRTQAVSTFRAYTSRTNGIAFGPDGVLNGCQEGSRRIVRFMPDGSASLPEVKLDGRYHNHPCHITVSGSGQLWFSDPLHAMPALGPLLPPYLEHRSVLRLTYTVPPRQHWHMQRMTFDTASPRGVALSPDGKTLYVSECDNAEGGTRELRAYPVDTDGTLGRPIVLHTFGADYRGVHRGVEGLCVDAAGNVIACAGWRRSGPGPTVYVFSPAGGVAATHAVPADMPLGCAFGDPGLASLYVGTADGQLLRARATGHVGHVPFLRK